jgi:hypothetical protein
MTPSACAAHLSRVGYSRLFGYSIHSVRHHVHLFQILKNTLSLLLFPARKSSFLDAGKYWQKRVLKGDVQFAPHGAGIL